MVGNHLMRTMENNIQTGILLENYNIFIEWNINREELITKLLNVEMKIDENKEFQYYGYKIKSKILGWSDTLTIVFNFVKNKMVSISIGDGEENIGLDVKESFIKRQAFLENKFGIPKVKNNLLRNFFRVKEECSYRWKIGSVKIEHSLFEGIYGITETLEIII